jgi:hypothetical protein
MKKVRPKKLALAKETLRTLENTALRQVAAADSGGSDSGSARCGSSDARLASCPIACAFITIATFLL